MHAGLHHATGRQDGRGEQAALLRHVVSAPFVYALLAPIALLDVSVSLYQAVCFRVWRIDQVRRSDFLLVDRHRLPYLNGMQKLNCVYCGYANGVLAYSREIAAVTEQYWCPIKHAVEPPAPHTRYERFASFGDADAFAEHGDALRDQLRAGVQVHPARNSLGDTVEAIVECVGPYPK